jgi:hypothetical protein
VPSLQRNRCAGRRERAESSSSSGDEVTSELSDGSHAQGNIGESLEQMSVTAPAVPTHLPKTLKGMKTQLEDAMSHKKSAIVHMPRHFQPWQALSLIKHIMLVCIQLLRPFLH